MLITEYKRIYRVKRKLKNLYIYIYKAIAFLAGCFNHQRLIIVLARVSIWHR